MDKPKSNAGLDLEYKKKAEEFLNRPEIIELGEKIEADTQATRTRLKQQNNDPVKAGEIKKNPIAIALVSVVLSFVLSNSLLGAILIFIPIFIGVYIVALILGSLVIQTK